MPNEQSVTRHPTMDPLFDGLLSRWRSPTQAGSMELAHREWVDSLRQQTDPDGFRARVGIRRAVDTIFDRPPSDAQALHAERRLKALVLIVLEDVRPEMTVTELIAALQKSVAS